MRPTRVLVCGTNYGRAYIQAIREAPKRYQLAGILALGSPRSRGVAKECGVRLFERAESLPREVDIACAAMGTSGAEVVLRLIERGIHVLCEHPQKPDYIETVFRCAASSGACFHINGHFAGLKASSAFIKHCNVVRQSESPSFLDLMATDRSLYAALDILRRVVTTFAPFELALRDRFSPFTVVQGTLGTVPVTFQVQGSGKAGGIVLQDGNPGYLVDYRITVGFPSGVLTLVSIGGPVVWNSSYSRSSYAEHRMWASVYGRPTTSGDLHKQRLRANLDAVHCLVKSARDHAVPPEQTARHLLDVSLVWERIGMLLRCPF